MRTIWDCDCAKVRTCTSDHCGGAKSPCYIKAEERRFTVREVVKWYLDNMDCHSPSHPIYGISAFTKRERGGR